MTPIELLAMLFMLVQGFGGNTEPAGSTTPSKPTTTPSKGSTPSRTTTTPSKPTTTPSKPTAAAKPPKKSATILRASTEAPKPWPTSATALPKYPSGWEPYVPPPPAVVSRANQLMSELWKSGKVGVTKQDQTNGRWVTYVTFAPSKGKRGVAAYRLKAGAPSGSVLKA